MANNKGNSKGIRGGIKDLMNSKKNSLFTGSDIQTELGLEEDQARSALYQLWKKGDIQRHVEDDPNYGARYALNIVEKNIRAYEQTRYIKKRISIDPLTPEEVESFFQEIQNACLIFDGILKKSLEFESRLINQLKDVEKNAAFFKEMKERMDLISGKTP